MAGLAPGDGAGALLGDPWLSYGRPGVSGAGTGKQYCGGNGCARQGAPNCGTSGFCPEQLYSGRGARPGEPGFVPGAWGQGGIALALDRLGTAAWRRGDFAAARGLMEEGLVLFRALDDQGRVAW